MAEKNPHLYSLSFNALVWNLFPVPGRHWLVAELRQEEKRVVTFAVLDYQKQQICWERSCPEESWWLNLADLSADQVQMKIFENTENPDTTRWAALSLETGDPVPYELKPYQSMDTNSVVHPFQYLAGEAYFDLVKNFLETRLPIKILLGVEYLETVNNILISYYTGAPGAFSNHLACFDKAGQLCWEDKIGTNLKGIGVNTFFLVSDYGFFVKNRTEVVTFRIV